MNMCFIFAILNSFRSLSVVFDLEARCVVKKIQEFFDIGNWHHFGESLSTKLSLLIIL